MASMGAAYEYISKLIGGSVEKIAEAVALGTGQDIIAQSDPERVWLSIVNLGSYDVYVSPAEGVSATFGYLLKANGGSVSLNLVDDFTMPTEQWYGVAIGGASTIFVASMRRFATGA